MATGLYSVEVNDGVIDGSQNHVLHVGQLSQSLILPILLAIGAVPVLDVTGLRAGGSHSLNVLQVLAADIRQNHILGVGQLSQSLILPELVALGAVPVLDLAIVVAAGLDSLEVDDVAALGGNNDILGVGDLGQSLVSPEALASGAEPVFNVTVVVASRLHSIEVDDGVIDDTQLNAQGVGDLGQSLVSPILLAVGAEPVLDVTLRLAGGSHSLDVLQVLAADIRQNHILGVGQLSQSLILPELVALGAVPVLDLAIVVAAGLDGLEVDHVAALGGNDNVLGVGDLSQSLILPEALAGGAEPVLNVTNVVATGLHSVEVDDGVVEDTQLNAQGVGDLGQSLVSPILLAVGAEPVLDVTLRLAGGSHSLDVLQVLAADIRQNHILGVGQLSQSLILPILLAIGAEPVLDLAVVVATGLDGLEVHHIAALSRQDHVLGVGDLGQSLISPEALAIGAEPVLDVTNVVATGLHSVEVNQTGVDVTDLTAQITIGIAGTVVLVSADHNGDRTVGAVKVDDRHLDTGTVEVALAVEGQSQGIGAGDGIVLNLEGQGSEQFTGVVAFCDSVAEIDGEGILGLGTEGIAGVAEVANGLQQLQNGGVVANLNHGRN